MIRRDVSRQNGDKAKIQEENRTEVSTVGGYGWRQGPSEEQNRSQGSNTYPWRDLFISAP